MSTPVPAWPRPVPRWSHTWRTFTHGRWEVSHVQPTPGSVRVTARPTGITVVIGDGPQSGSWLTTVELGLDGRVTVHTSASPPCVVLSPREVRAVPNGPGGIGTAVLDVGDRLLMMSAEALGALPEALSAMRRSGPASEVTDGTGDLLERLLRDLPTGAAAVATCTSPPPLAIAAPWT